MMFASILAVLGGWLGFANPVYRLPILALLLPAGLAAAAVRAQNPGRAARIGFVVGSLAALGNLYWAALPIHDYGDVPWPLALPIPMLLAMALGVYDALFAAVVRFAQPRLSPWLFGPLAGLAWAAMEMARGHFFTGFPWLVLPAALAPWPAAVQGAAFLGVYGLAGLLAWLAVWLAVPGPLTRQGLAAVLIGATLFVLGNRRLASPPPRDGVAHVTIVQGNVDQSRKWDPEAQAATEEEYVDLTAKALGDAPTDLVVWPETAMPFFFQDKGPLAERLTQYVASAGVPLLFGAPAHQRLPNGSQVYFNRAYLLTPNGTAGSYDKEHLVPFGEYVPLGAYLTFIHKLVAGVGDFQPGSHQSPLGDGRLALGVLVCYEAIFPELAQQRVEAGANLLVNISNDAWFGDSPAPRQHLDLTLLRAVEQGRAIIRGTNTGISAAIDPRGRILAQGGLFTALTLPCPEVPLVSETTWFHRHYALVTWGIPVLLGIMFLGCLLTPARPRFTGPSGQTL
jgi:apolipoprotein N-acyltransferase